MPRDFVKLNGTTWEYDLPDGKAKVGGDNPNIFVPSVRLPRWGGIASLEIEHLTEKNLEPVQSEGKLQWKDQQDGREIHFYTRSMPTVGLKHGDPHYNIAFEFETILTRMPLFSGDVYNLDFKLKSNGLDFHYQPSLEEERKTDPSAYRHPAVEHSYAVYHKTKKGHRKGEDWNYRNGKAYHIYRPQLIDDANNRIWGTLYIDPESGLFRVSIPRAFLETAIYPIRHASGATFGHTNGGGSYTTVEDYIRYNQIYTTECGTWTSMWAQLWDENDNHTAACAVYVDADDSLFASTDTNSNITDTVPEQYYEFDFDPAVSNTSEWDCKLCCWGDGQVWGFDINYDSSSNAGGWDGNTNTFTWPEPLDPSTQSRNYAVYVEYTPGSCGGAAGPSDDELRRRKPYGFILGSLGSLYGVGQLSRIIRKPLETRREFLKNTINPFGRRN